MPLQDPATVRLGSLPRPIAATIIITVSIAAGRWIGVDTFGPITFRSFCYNTPRIDWPVIRDIGPIGIAMEYAMRQSVSACFTCWFNGRGEHRQDGQPRGSEDIQQLQSGRLSALLGPCLQELER